MGSTTSSIYPLMHDAAYPFLFCTLCKYAVLVPSICDHLKDVHDDKISTNQRKAVREAASRLSGMYQRKEDMINYKFPSLGDCPIPHLRDAVTDGLRCNECGWITRSKPRMRAHCGKTHAGGSNLRWRANVHCQRLFAKGPNSVWFEVSRQEDVVSSDLTAWLFGGDTSLQAGQTDTGYYNTTGDIEPCQPTIDVNDAEAPNRPIEQSSQPKVELIDQPISSSQSRLDSARLDPSWFAVAKSRACCVLCTVRGFEWRCMLSMTSSAAAAKESRTKEAQRANRAAACDLCGLQDDWHETNTRGPEVADSRLQDDKLICVARMVALWEQMKLAGASIGNFDAKQMAVACTWLETGNTDIYSDTGGNIGTREQNNKYETPRGKTVIQKNGQITPADEREESVDMFVGEELSIIEMDAIQSSISAPVSSGYKRKASNDLDSSPLAKSRRTGEAIDERECAVPSLFNEAIVAQVRRTDTGMWHEAMRQHELDAYTKWLEQYLSGHGDNRSKAVEFRRLHNTWKGRCGICWFSCRAAKHSPDMCPHKSSATWRSAMQQADVIRSKVLTKRTVEGKAVGWPASSGCWKCGLPAWRCDSFERIPSRFFRPRVPEVACPDENLLRHIAGSVLAHFEAGAACVVAHVKESWGQEKTRLDSQDGIEWLQDYSCWTNPECSFFALVVFELEKFGALARSI
ncbi:hypothetical protein VFPPC_16935 [Pochonia chlamydosporia 170]|uniref:C2H2-type domain-containing protein n=1 Tax=Pochonia chlamydosporia 170 TaxID=1380566 RepID=A0A179F178_METCM|nr:hypothetical protein VFPPC_16935 [Pochonia chlamydosporia 170]OAQ58899.2 hypothetical protein VFPPC_16935 [Pochonia chlamydosporia 170]